MFTHRSSSGRARGRTLSRARALPHWLPPFPLPPRAGCVALRGQGGAGAALAARALAGAFHAPAGFPIFLRHSACVARSYTSKLYLTSGTAHGTISTVQDGRCNLLCCYQTPFNANKGYHILPSRVKWYPLFFHFFFASSSASAYNIVTASSEWFSNRCTRSKLPCA